MPIIVPINLSLRKKALPTTFLPSVKTLTKNILLFFLLAQVFFFVKKEKVFLQALIYDFGHGRTLYP